MNSIYAKVLSALILTGSIVIFANAWSLNAQINESIRAMDQLEATTDRFNEEIMSELENLHDKVESLRKSTDQILNEFSYSEGEIDLIAICTMAEAEGEPELGQRLVIDTILNRVEHEDFPNTVKEVIYAPNQFSSMTNGRAERCYVKESIRNLVIHEITDRTDQTVLYFRTGHFHDFGIELYKIGNHYFSTK